MSNLFSREVLTNPEVLTFINQNLLFWACSVNTGEGYRVSQALRDNAHPFLAMIVLREGRMTVVARYLFQIVLAESCCCSLYCYYKNKILFVFKRMEGAVDGSELLRRLRTVIKENEICLTAARAER